MQEKKEITTVTFTKEDLADLKKLKLFFSTKTLGIKISLGRVLVAAAKYVVENKMKMSIENRKIKFTKVETNENFE